MTNDDIKTKILDFLSSIPDKWEYSSQIAQSIGYNRVTISKYLDILYAEKKIQKKSIGKAKLWSLAEPSKPIVLVVDDEPHIVQLLKLSLDPEFYSVIDASDGEDGVKKAFEYAPDIIILDVMMPKKNGFEVCHELKSHSLTQHIPILMLSAKQEVDDKVKGLTLGADQYMPKPFDPMELEARVNSVLKRQKSQHQRNAVTGLPSSQSIHSFLAHNDVPSVTFEVQHLDVVREIFGYRKADEILQFISRLLALDLKDQSPVFIGQPADTQFTVCAKQFSIKQFERSLQDTLPFLYGVESFTKNMFTFENKTYPVITLHVL